MSFGASERVERRTAIAEEIEDKVRRLAIRDVFQHSYDPQSYRCEDLWHAMSQPLRSIDLSKCIPNSRCDYALQSSDLRRTGKTVDTYKPQTSN
ncbi:aldehyde dehydrogenase [Moniliophthora roreri]|nr:aldehyde dehydrogenase [Moniliophthora roreri]